MDEFDAVEHGQTFAEMAFHPVSARTRVEYDRKPTVFARVAQRGLELCRLAIGRLEKPLALERLTATQIVEAFGIQDFESSFGEQALRHEG